MSLLLPHSVILYIYSSTDEFIIGNLEGKNDYNNELASSIELGRDMGSDFVAAIFPNPLKGGLKLIQEIKDLNQDGIDCDLKLTIPTFDSIKETDGAVLVLIFSVYFLGTIVLIYKNAELKDSVMIETDKGIQITH